MDPITTAIVAALAAGLIQGTVADAYNVIKHLIKRKSSNSDMLDAIEKLEKKPQSKARQLELQEQVEEYKLDKNVEIVEAAKKLMDEMKLSSNEKHIMQAKGNCIAQANHGSSASVNINR